MFRNYCFTLNNPTDGDEDLIWKLRDIASYLLLGRETGASGTFHYQGYVEFPIQKRPETVHKLLPRAHWEVRRGSQKQAIDYCKKTDDWEDYGDCKEQGKRSDLAEACAIAISEGACAVGNAMPCVYVKFHRGLEALERSHRPCRTEWEDIDVTVLWGAPGTGKTRQVFEKEKSLFIVNTDSSFPFDGYKGEEAILFDDFYGEIKYNQMLRLLDGYPMTVNVKHGREHANWKRVYLTSNKHPREWYPEGLGALERRIKNVSEVGVILGVPTSNTRNPREGIIENLEF